MIDEKPELSFPHQHFCSAPDRSEVSFATMNSHNANTIYRLHSDNGECCPLMRTMWWQLFQ